MLGSGFIITMMMGMGMRMIPAFETKRIPWKKGPWVVYTLIASGTAIRVPAQAINRLDYLAIGGGLQFLGIITFVFLMLSMYLVGKKVHVDLPATQIFEEKDAASRQVKNKKEKENATVKT